MEIFPEDFKRMDNLQDLGRNGSIIVKVDVSRMVTVGGRFCTFRIAC
jgi:hypothetical protein